jgi:hypothetical protein
MLYAFRRDTGGSLVCCKHGNITHDGSKNDYWVPYDKYRVVATKDSPLLISQELQAVRNMVLAGTFDVKLQKNLLLSKYVDKELQSMIPVKRTPGRKCSPKGCTRRCGCRTKGHKCHSECMCNGNCGN